MTPLKPKFPRAAAIAVARELCAALEPVCDRMIVAGSLRRRKDQVGDVEILYIPKTTATTVDLFAQETKVTNHADDLLVTLLDRTLIMRPNSAGGTAWGPKNKLAIHIRSGIPVDLFSATPDNWFNYLVCRTGSAEHNIKVASRAQMMGWKWDPYSPGFHRTEGLAQLIHPIPSEAALFEFLNLPYREPWER